ncbi:MAG: VCBS repeat-containing protein [Actinobacteria bacterium]|nr:VCBS repeat-containing protein [Actinomycetota bacterium]
MSRIASRRQVAVVGLIGVVVGILVTAAVIAPPIARAGDGDTFLLGRKNVALHLTKLVAKNGFLVKSTRGIPLTIEAPDGQPPLAVNSSALVSGLNADLLDGEDATAFADADHDHDTDYLGIDATAADSDLLDGQDSTAFADADHDHDADYLAPGATTGADGLPALGIGCLFRGGFLLSLTPAGDPFCSAPGGSGALVDTGQSLGSTDGYSVALGDLDGDGDLDAFVAVNGGGNEVWFNDAGTFSTSGQSLGTSDSWDVALGDVDDDGDLDAFIANSGTQADVLWLNDGTGSFTASPQPLGTGDGHGGAFGDLDGDGDLDLFVANDGDGEADTVWTNDGSGTFTNSAQSLGTFHSFSVALGDLDGDGDLDAFVSTYNDEENAVWLNDGTGGFAYLEQPFFPTNTWDAALGDLDGDGDLDAVVSEHGGSNIARFNDGTGYFSSSVWVLSGEAHYNWDVGLGDLDGDGDLDAYFGSSGSDEVFLNDGDGTSWTDTTQVFNVVATAGVGIGDLNADGALDVFAAVVTDGHEVWTG